MRAVLLGEAGGGELSIGVLARSHHGVLQAELLVGQLKHVVLVGALGAQLVDLHGLGLADPMYARHRLHIVLRVPVGVEDNDRVGRGQVDPHAARARREYEDEGVGVLIGEAINRPLPLGAGDGAIEPLEAPPLGVRGRGWGRGWDWGWDWSWGWGWGLGVGYLRLEDVRHQVEHLG